MGILGTLLGILLPALIGIGTTWLGNKVNAGQLTGAESQQNAFNAQQAQVSREFTAEQNQIAMDYNAAEAQKSRDFTAVMDNTMYQRRVADMQAAGVNPALAIGGVHSGTISSAAGSVAPGASASAAGNGRGVPSVQSMSDIMQGQMLSKNLSLLDSQIQMNDAKTMRDLAEAGLLGEQRIGQNLANTWFEPMKEAELNNLLSDLQSKDVQRALNRANIKVSEAEEALKLTQNIISKADAATRDQLNRASIRLTLSQAGLNTALGNESKKRLGLIDAEINELYQRSIMESMQAGKFSADEIEAMARVGLIEEQKEGVYLENVQKRYNVKRPGLNYWLGTAGQAASIVGNVVGIGVKGALAGSVLSRGLPQVSWPYGTYMNNRNW